MQVFQFRGARLPAEAEEMRTRVRAFPREEREAGRYAPHRSS